MNKLHELRVRRATPADLDAIAHVWHASASEIAAIGDMPSQASLRARVDAELASGWELYLAARDERVVGMLALVPALSTLDQIFVLPGEQNSGVGKALLDLAKQAMPAGFTLRMSSSNDRARRFYEKQGLKLHGTGRHPRTGVPVCYYRWEA